MISGFKNNGFWAPMLRGRRQGRVPLEHADSADHAQRSHFFEPGADPSAALFSQSISITKAAKRKDIVQEKPTIKQ